MPNYKTHNTANLFFFLPLYFFLLAVFFDVSGKQLFTFGSSFIYASLFLSPDVDLTHKVRLFSLRGVLTIPYRAYGLFFKHRGLSHHFLLGTASRIFWLAGFFYLVFRIFALKQPILFTKKDLNLIVFVTLGIFFADLSHLALDRVKQRRRRR